MKNKQNEPFLITRKNFISKLDFIQEQKELQRKASDCFSGFIEGFFTFFDKYEEELINALEILILEEDLDDGFIGWWVYETDFGKNPSEVSFGKKEYLPKNNEEFYDMVVELYYFKKNNKK